MCPLVVSTVPGIYLVYVNMNSFMQSLGELNDERLSLVCYIDKSTLVVMVVSYMNATQAVPFVLRKRNRCLTYVIYLFKCNSKTTVNGCKNLSEINRCINVEGFMLFIKQTYDLKLF